MTAPHSVVDPVPDVVTDMTLLVSLIVRVLVDNSDSVQVVAVSGQNGTILRVHVDPGDVGKLIGKQGRTARSLRAILTAASTKLKHRFTLDIYEAYKGRRDSRQA